MPYVDPTWLNQRIVDVEARLCGAQAAKDSTNMQGGFGERDGAELAEHLKWDARVTALDAELTELVRVRDEVLPAEAAKDAA